MRQYVTLFALMLTCAAAFAGPRAYITSCCYGGASASFIDNSSNTEAGFLPSKPIAAIAFSPDSQTAYIADSAGTISVVDLATRKISTSFSDAYGPTAIAISPSGQTAYVAEIGPGNGSVTAFSLPQGQVIAHITLLPSYQCTDVKISADGAALYVACQQPPIESSGANYFSVIDTATNTVTKTLQTFGGGFNAYLAVSADSTHAYMTVHNSSFAGYVVIDLASLTVTARPALPDISDGLTINPAGTALYSSDVGVVYAVAPATGKILAKIRVPSGQGGLAVTPDGSRLYAANYGTDTVSVVDLATNQAVASVAAGALPLQVAVSPDGSTTLTGNGGSTQVYTVDTGTGKVTGRFEGGTNPAGLVLSPDQTRAFIVDQGLPNSPTGHAVMVFNTSNFKRLAQIPIQGAYTIAIKPDGSTVYCGANTYAINGASIAVIDASTYSVTATIPLGTLTASAPTLAISPDGSTLYAAYTDVTSQNTLAVISTSANTVTQTIPLSVGASFAGPFVALSVDGARAYVTLTNASQLAIVDTAAKQLLTTVTISPSYPVSLAMHPNGTTAYLVSSLGYNGILVFDLTTNRVTGEIRAPGVPVPFNVAFTPDGSTAYMTEELGPVLIIDTASAKITGELPLGNSNTLGVTIAAH